MKCAVDRTSAECGIEHPALADDAGSRSVLLSQPTPKIALLQIFSLFIVINGKAPESPSIGRLSRGFVACVLGLLPVGSVCTLSGHRCRDCFFGPLDLRDAVARLELPELGADEEENAGNDGFHHATGAGMFGDADFGGEAELLSSVVDDVHRAAPEERAHHRALGLQVERGPRREGEEGEEGESGDHGAESEKDIGNDPCEQGRHGSVEGDACREQHGDLAVAEDVADAGLPPQGEGKERTGDGKWARNAHEVPRL